MDSEGYSSAQTENLTPRETTALPKRKRCWKGKRFSDEQIKSLESIFKLETKLEAKKKLQLARELGLQPRQIAIWFQNRRARWKSKQIEEDYRGLKASFDSLSMQFESLKQEKESLLTQLERLSDLLRSPNDDGHSGSKDSEENGNSNGPEEEDKNLKSIKEGLDHHEVMYTNDNEAGSSELFHKDSSGVIKNTEQKEEPESFKFGEYKDTSLASPEEWRNLDLGGLFTQSCGTSKWWEF